MTQINLLRGASYRFRERLRLHVLIREDTRRWYGYHRDFSRWYEPNPFWDNAVRAMEDAS